MLIKIKIPPSLTNHLQPREPGLSILSYTPTNQLLTASQLNTIPKIADSPDSGLRNTRLDTSNNHINNTNSHPADLSSTAKEILGRLKARRDYLQMINPKTYNKRDDDYKKLDSKYSHQKAIVLSKFPDVEPADIDIERECLAREKKWTKTHADGLIIRRGIQRQFNSYIKYFSQLSGNNDLEKSKIGKLKSMVTEKIGKLNETMSVPFGVIDTLNELSENYTVLESEMESIINHGSVQRLNQLEPVEVDEWIAENLLLGVEEEEAESEDSEQPLPSKVKTTKIPKSILKNLEASINLTKRSLSQPTNTENLSNKKQKVNHVGLSSDAEFDSQDTTSQRDSKRKELDNKETNPERFKQQKLTTPPCSDPPTPKMKKVEFGPVTINTYELASTEQNPTGTIYVNMSQRKVIINQQYKKFYQKSKNIIQSEYPKILTSLEQVNTRLDDKLYELEHKAEFTTEFGNDSYYFSFESEQEKDDYIKEYLEELGYGNNEKKVEGECDAAMKSTLKQEAVSIMQ